MNKKLWITLGIIAAVIVVIVAPIVGMYNNLVTLQTEVEAKHSTIDVNLQRRADLIPNFVETVKDYMDYEQETFLAVTEARNAVNKAANASEQAAASDQLDSAIRNWVSFVAEAYPELKASEQFRALQDELAGTENRIAVSRKDYNEAVKSYNTAIRRFPKSVIAGMFGFDPASYFEAAPGAEQVPSASVK